MLHLMVDIETISRQHNAGILSIGAVLFHPSIKGDLLAKEWRIKAESNLDYGRHLSTETLDWWKQQSPESREIAFSGEMDLADALSALYRFSQNAEKIWACDPDFDLNILEDACLACNVPFAFKFYQRLAVRTIKWLAWPDGGAPTIQGVAHSAIDDAKHQCDLVCEAFSVISGSS
jgi:exodeoxyribonuclease VIII